MVRINKARPSGFSIRWQKGQDIRYNIDRTPASVTVEGVEGLGGSGESEGIMGWGRVLPKIAKHVSLRK